jgi:hypothetical protein
MGFIQITTVSENGVTTKDLSELTADERLSLEVDVDLALNGLEEVKLLCVVCLAPVQVGLGHCYCPRHARGR